MKKKINFISATMVAGLMTTLNVNAQNWTIGGNALTATGKLGATSSQSVNLITNNVSRVFIKKTGEVGIGGITAPTGKLNVADLDLSAINSTGSIQLGLTTGKNLVMDNDEIQARTNGVASTLLLNYRNSSDISMCFGNSVLKGGSVSIGKAANYGRLNISADSSASGAQTVASFGTDGPGISIVRNWPGIYFNSYWDNAAGNKKSMAAGFGGIIELRASDGLLALMTTTAATGAGQVITETGRVWLTNSGKLGIGTSAPASIFHVAEGSSGLAPFASSRGTFESSGPSYISLLSGSNNENGILFGTNGTSVAGAIVYNNSGTLNGLQFRTNGNNNGMVLNSAGNVGIGTITPSYKLDVCGVIRSKEVRVETGWCDYVFAADYKLPALSEVEAYIKANKHLPDVTAGNIIETEGLEVGKTSAQLIKKIEELTLYVIELQKQVDALKASNK